MDYSNESFISDVDGLPKKMSLNVITLSFKGACEYLEAHFRNYYFEKFSKQIRICFICGFALFGLFAVLDAVLLPEFKYKLWAIRFIYYAPASATIIFLTFSKLYKKFFELTSFFTMFVSGAALIAMLMILPVSAGNLYYVGIILVIIFGYTFSRTRFIVATFSNLMILLSYNVIAIFFLKVPFANLLSNNFFLFSANCIGMFACYEMEYTSRHEYYMTLLLQLGEEKVKSVNEQLSEMNLHLQKLATIDTTTQLANRRMFDTYMKTEWLRSIRTKEPLSLIICDIDFFKNYNDFYGHLKGDHCLRAVAAAIKAIPCRPLDLVARYGGEEFVIVLPNTNFNGAVTIANNIMNAVRDLKISHAKSTVSEYVTVSVGVSKVNPSKDYQPEKLIEYADKALYSAKENGRNRVTAQIYE